MYEKETFHAEYVVVHDPPENNYKLYVKIMMHFEHTLGCSVLFKFRYKSLHTGFSSYLNSAIVPFLLHFIQQGSSPC